MNIYNNPVVKPEEPNEKGRVSTNTLLSELQRLYDDTGSHPINPPAGQGFIPSPPEHDALLFSPYSFVPPLGAGSSYNSPLDTYSYSTPSAYFPLPTPPLQGPNDIYAWKEPANGWTDVAFPDFEVRVCDSAEDPVNYPVISEKTEKKSAHVCDVCYRPFKRYVYALLLTCCKDLVI
jgi:hypothetical protein